MLPFNDNVRITGALTVTQGISGATRGSLAAQNDQVYELPMQDMRIWDAFQTGLTTAASDDLGIATGTFGTGLPYITTGDLKAAGSTTRRARILFTLPPEYVAGQPIVINCHAGMVTTVAGTAATVDVEAYLSGANTLVSGVDLVATAAITINSLTFADKEFTITATDLEPGDILDLRISVLVNDAATVTAVIGAIAHAEMWLTVQG